MRCAPSSATFTILVLSRGRGSSQLLPFIRANQGTRNIARKTVTVRGSHTFCKLQAKHSSAPGHVTLSQMSNALLNRLRLHNSSANVWCLCEHLRRATQTYEEAARGTHTHTHYAPGPSVVTPHRSLIPSCIPWLRRHSYISPAPLLPRWCGGAGLRGRAWGAIVASFALAIAAAAPRRLLPIPHSHVERHRVGQRCACLAVRC